MAGNYQRPGQGGMPGLKPPSAGRRSMAHGGGRNAETQKHAEEVRALAQGRDIVDDPAEQEKRPAAFDRKELMVVRSWMKRRPLEPTPAATALIQYPRQWTTKRGRYCKFRAPGAGVYGILRARPTF